MSTEQGRGGHLGMHKVAAKPSRCPVRDAFEIIWNDLKCILFEKYGFYP
jgi:hypothetical protein